MTGFSRSLIATWRPILLVKIPGKAFTNIGQRKYSHLQYGEEGWFTGNRRAGDEYRERIHQIESDGGVYSYKLLPELIGLGLLSQEQSKPAESAEVFERALYIIRANDCLYSTRQLPLLDLMIVSNTTLEKWKQVAKSYDMMHWLYKRNFAENDAQKNCC